MSDPLRPEPAPASPPPASPPPAGSPPAGGSRPPGIPERRYAGPPRAASPVTGPSRWERLVASWRIALRLGRRDVVRHKGRSALIVIMVALPVALLVAGNLLYSTQDLTAVEKLDYALGRAQARITPTDTKVTPTPYFDMGYFGGEGTPKAIPGWGTDVASQRAALAQLTGGTVVEIGQSGLEVRVGKKITGTRKVRSGALVVAGGALGSSRSRRSRAAFSDEARTPTTTASGTSSRMRTSTESIES